MSSARILAIFAVILTISHKLIADEIYDIPRLDNIEIDGKAEDWGDRGFRVDGLKDDSITIRPRDFAV